MKRSAKYFEELYTERLHLREITEEDDVELLSLRADPTVNLFLNRTAPGSIEDVRMFIENIRNGIQEHKWLYWAVSMRDKPDLIGTICLWNFSDDRKYAELGFELLPAFQHHGLMTEAVKSVLHYGANRLGVKRFEAFVHPSNTSSINLLRRFDFRRVTPAMSDINEKLEIYALPSRGLISEDTVKR